MEIASATNKEEIYLGIIEVLHEMFELDKSKLTLEANLYADLDIDSIDAVDLVVKLNELTGKRLQPDVFKAVRTIQNVVDALADMLLEKAI